MKKYLFPSLLLIAVGTLLSHCSKDDDLSLTGTSSTADYTFAQQGIGDTLPYTPTVAFTDASEKAFLYQWNFGDNTALSSVKDPTHTFSNGGSYNVTLTTVGTNGNNSVTKVIAVSDACQNDFYNKLTGGCATGEWTWSTDGDAIKVLSADATQVYFAGGAAGCQADDVFKFTREGNFIYDAKGQTFDVQSGYSCQPQKENAPKFKVVAKTNELPKIVLAPLASGNGQPFIGTTDIMADNAYVVQSYTESNMTLRGTDASTGNLIEVKLKKVTAQTIDDIYNLLTSKQWSLDPAGDAKAIIVGTENNPGEYFGGGTLEGCQLDDVYSFSKTNVVTYNAAGATFNGGNVAPNYNCGSDRSYSIPYAFAATTGGVAGLGTITLPGAAAPPVNFIGVTDVPSENVYRIIEISSTNMVLRAGNGSGTVFQFKFIAL